MFTLEKTYVTNDAMLHKLHEMSNMLNSLKSLSLNPKTAETIAKTKLQSLANEGLHISLVEYVNNSAALVFKFKDTGGTMHYLSQILCYKSDVNYLNGLNLVPESSDKLPHHFMNLEGKLTPTDTFGVFNNYIKELLESTDFVILKNNIKNAVKTHSTNKCNVNLESLLMNFRSDDEISSLETIINLLIKVTVDADIFTSNVRLCYIRRSDKPDLIESVHISKCAVTNAKLMM